MKFIERAVKLLPIVSIALLGIGYLYLCSVFFFFDIEMHHYLSFSEIPMLLMNRVVAIFSILLTMLLYVKNFGNDKVSNKEKSLETTIKKTTRRKNKILIILLVLLLISCVISIALENYFSLIHIGVVLLLIVFGTKSLIDLFFNIKSVFGETIGFITIFAFVICILFFSYCFSDAMNKSYKMRFGEECYQEVVIYKNDETIKTSKNLVYVGRTQGYLFLFDRTTKETIAINAAVITKLKISQCAANI